MLKPASSHRAKTPWLIRRAANSLTLGCAAALALAGVALANAPDPEPGSQALVGPVYTVDGVDVVRVSLSGTWQWPTHGTDCNTDRNGVGYAVDWEDPNQLGNHVETLVDAGSIDVGAASANNYNSADNGVHPTRPEADGTLFNDPGDPALYEQWRSGCGTFDGAMPVGIWGAVDLVTGEPVTCTDESTPSPTCLGGSHVYTVASLEDGLTACAILYDVHGGDADTGGAPNQEKEVTAGGNGHNTDNGAEANGATAFSLACAQVDGPVISTPTPDPSLSPLPGDTPNPEATPSPTTTVDPNATPSPTPAPTDTPDPTASPSATPAPTDSPVPNVTPDPNATATPTPDPNATPDPNTTPTPDPDATLDPTGMPDTAVLGGPSSGAGIGAQLAALVGGAVALATGLFAATRRSGRLTARTAGAVSGPWSTNPFDGSRR